MADLILDLSGANEDPLSLGGAFVAHASTPSTLRLESNVIIANGSLAAMKYDGAVDDDQGIEVVVPADGGQRMKLYVRDQASAGGFTGYMIVLDFDTLTECRIKTVIDGLETTRVGSVTMPAFGDVIHFYAIGQTVYYDLNGVNEASWEDTSNTYPTGDVLLGIQSAGVEFNAVTITGATVAVNPILTFDMKDAENSNALILSETNLNVTVYDAAGGTELYQTLTATSHASTGVVVIDDDLVGAVDDSVFVVAVRSNGQTVCGYVTVTNGA
jgi:hypothetical protein